MRSLIIATWVLLIAASSAFAQAPACPTGQTYDQTQKKCVSSGASKSTGY
jgi:hypothetical protein